jgi:hypothetical protein
MSRSSYIVPFLIGAIIYALIAMVLVCAFSLWMNDRQLTWWLLSALMTIFFSIGTAWMYMGMMNYEIYWAESPLDSEGVEV